MILTKRERLDRRHEAFFMRKFIVAAVIFDASGDGIICTLVTASDGEIPRRNIEVPDLTCGCREYSVTLAIHVLTCMAVRRAESNGRLSGLNHVVQVALVNVQLKFERHLLRSCGMICAAWNQRADVI